MPSGNPKARHFRGRYPERGAIRGQTGGYITDGYLLAQVLQPMLEREGARLHNDYCNKYAHNRNGAIYIVAERASVELGITADSIARRMYQVMNDKSDMLRCSTAEALVSACGEIFLLEPVPTFPTNRQSAQDMAEAWAEKGEDVDALARSLLRLSVGWFSSEEIVDPETFEKRKEARLPPSRKKERV